MRDAPAQLESCRDSESLTRPLFSDSTNSAMQKLPRVLGAQVSLFAAATALSVNLPRHSFRPFILTVSELASSGQNALSGPKHLSPQHDCRVLRISESGSNLWKRVDPDYLSRQTRFISAKPKFYAAESYRKQVERASHNSKHGPDEIESKLSQFGRMIKSSLGKLRSHLESKLKSLRGDAALAESAPEAPPAGSSSIQMQSDTIQV
jgi:hypothetical protein